MLRNIIYIIISTLLFFSGIVIYGVVLNLREVSLSEAMIEKNIDEIISPSILIDRRNYKLNLYSDTILVKSYNVVFGRNNGSIKHTKDDFVTPSGEYKICSIDTNNLYYKKMYINYPNVRDASEALKVDLINKNEYLMIVEQIDNNDCPINNTILGYDIGIQGTGDYNIIFKNLPFVFNWTNGSIALSNENIDELLKVIGIGTKVTIRN